MTIKWDSPWARWKMGAIWGGAVSLTLSHKSDFQFQNNSLVHSFDFTDHKEHEHEHNARLSKRKCFTSLRNSRRAKRLWWLRVIWNSQARTDWDTKLCSSRTIAKLWYCGSQSEADCLIHWAHPDTYGPARVAERWSRTDYHAVGCPAGTLGNECAGIVPDLPYLPRAVSVCAACSRRAREAEVWGEGLETRGEQPVLHRFLVRVHVTTEPHTRICRLKFFFTTPHGRYIICMCYSYKWNLHHTAAISYFWSVFVHEVSTWTIRGFVLWNFCVPSSSLTGH